MSIIIKHKQNGFTLLEILVTLVILAIGLLGLLSLQMVSLKNNHSAQQRTTAIVHTYDILDRIRLNRTVNYSIGFADVAANPATIEGQDITEWKANIARELPAGQGRIEDDGTIVIVEVRWDETRAGNQARGTGGSNKQSFIVSTQK
jgi:type IV pilus assembly protein PilV